MNKKLKNNFFTKYNLKWTISITIWTFIMAIIFSMITENLTTNLGILSSFGILMIIITTGILFDIIGIAVTKAEEKPFHSMASRKISEAKVAIRLVRNADKVSNFCNDVVGDISGIISGAVGANLIHKLSTVYDVRNLALVSILLTSLIAAFTVGGKAFGKTFALTYYEKIIYRLSMFLNFFEINLNFEIFKDKKNIQKNFKDRER